MTDIKESKRKKILHNIESFYSMLQKNENERILKPQKTNRTVNPREKPDLTNLFDKTSHDFTNGSEKNINYQNYMNPYYDNKSWNDRNQIMINSTLNQDQHSNSQEQIKRLNNTKENNGQQYPIIKQESYEKVLKNFQIKNYQKPRNFMEKNYQSSYDDDQQWYNYGDQRKYNEKVPTFFNPPTHEFQGTDQQDDLSEVLHKIQFSQIGNQSLEAFFPGIKDLKKIYTPEQLKAIICDTIREEIKRANNPLLSSSEKSMLNERHRDLANNLNKHHLVINQNIIHKNGQNSASNKNNPSHNDFSFGDQNNHNNPLRSSKATSKKLYSQVINLRDNDPKQFKQLSQKIQANSKTQKDKKASHNMKVTLGSIATLGGIAIKVARDVKSHYQEPSSSIQSNIMSCGKAMVGGAVGKILGEKINPKLKNAGALIGVLATSDKANKRMGKILQKTGKYLHKFAQTQVKQQHTNQKSAQHHLYQEFLLYENQQQGKN